MKRAIVVALIVAGCPDRPVSKVDPHQEREETKEIQVDFNRDLDILFVIDNSGSMTEEQASLTGNFQQFMNVLQMIEGGLPNVHIGVVSTNVGVGGYVIGGCEAQGDDGRLQNAPRGACSPPMGYFIADVANPDGTRDQNYSGTLAETFACIAKLGTAGCGFEQPLESMKRALDGSNAQNAGFLRPGAWLAVVFVTDEDDCSASDPAVFDPANDDLNGPLGPLDSFRCAEFGIECDGAPISRTAADYSPPGVCEPRSDSPYLRHPQEYVDFLRSLKPDDPSLIIVAGIIGNPTPVRVSVDPLSAEPSLVPSCMTLGAGVAAPAVRLDWFLEQFPNRSTEVSICSTDLSDALTKIAELLARVLGTPCLGGAIQTDDLHPDTPGVQLDCAVADVRYRGTDQQEERIIARCDMQDEVTPIVPTDGSACWWAKVDEESCGCGCTTSDECGVGSACVNGLCDPCRTPTHLAIFVEPQDRQVPSGTEVVARCMAD